MTANEFFEQQLITDANSVIDKNAHKYNRSDLVNFATAYHKAVLYNEANPIPLTKEWLNKFGFVYDKNNFEYKISPENYCRTIILRQLGANSYSVIVKVIHEVSIGWLEYVHQLQNLYFWLTGEELTIKTIKI